MNSDDDQVEDSTPLSTLARSGSAAFFGLSLNAILTFVFTVIVAHELGPRRAGALFEAIAIFTIIAGIGTVGSDLGLLRFLPGLRASRKEAVPKLIVVAVVPTVVVSIIGAGFVYFFADELARVFVSRFEVIATGHILRIFAVFIPIASTMAVILAATRAWTIGAFVWIYNILVPLLRVLLVLVAIVLVGRSLLFTAFSWAIPLAMGLVFSAGVLLRRVRETQGRPTVGVLDTLQWRLVTNARFLLMIDTTVGPRGNTLPQEEGLWSYFWRFSLARSLATTFDIFLVWVDVLLVGAIAGPANAAVYTIVSRYVSLSILPTLAVGFAIAPEASRLLHLGLRGDANKLYRTSTVWITVIGFPILLVLAVFSPIFLSVFGIRYVTGAVALTIISLSLLVNTGTGNNAILLLMAGRSSWNLLISGFSLSLNVVANLILIPRFGLTGAAVAWAISILVTNACSTIVLWKFDRMQPFSWPLAYVAGLSVLCYGIGGIIVRLMFETTHIVTTGISLIVITALYSAGIYLRRTSLDLQNFGALLRRL
jgi:O-antigen/teichoic acid export membrane protein